MVPPLCKNTSDGTSAGTSYLLCKGMLAAYYFQIPNWLRKSNKRMLSFNLYRSSTTNAPIQFCEKQFKKQNYCEKQFKKQNYWASPWKSRTKIGTESRWQIRGLPQNRQNAHTEKLPTDAPPLVEPRHCKDTRPTPAAPFSAHENHYSQ
jgi:hypothetical protein